MANSNPYGNIGMRLRRLREAAGEEVREVASAIEVTEEEMSSYERGQKKPEEDILLLLINHFDLQDDDALRLWELADYDGDIELQAEQKLRGGQNTMLIMPVDMRITYTDMVQVSANNYGIVVNFLQGLGPTGQPLPVARVGMSYDHAESVIKVLSDTLKQAKNGKQQKHLPSPKNSEEA